jgi:hypothetical protein
MLASHADIATASEPWFLLPYLYTLRENGAYAEYGHSTMVAAIRDLCDDLPNGRADYLAQVRQLALGLYENLAPTETYFLDKTPRYHLVVDEVIDLFPEAKFVFLWRNPLAVVASITDTFGRGHWNIHHYTSDLVQGLDRLVQARDRLGDAACALRFEDLVRDPEVELRKICSYLDLPFDGQMIDPFSDVRPKRGDIWGMDRYGSLDEEPLNKWQRTLGGPIRKAWCRRYLSWLGPRRLALMGYDPHQLSGELNSLPTEWLRVGSDAARTAHGVVLSIRTSRLLKSPRPSWPPRAASER